MVDRAEFEAELTRLVTNRNTNREEATMSIFYAFGFHTIEHRDVITKIMKTANERFEAEHGEHI